ncbi:hypothetical protein A2Z23_02145 [Candidatus Curtissbacteria bacterium RBG_16_39_7]|uniref:Proline--tRNA ligase n=1 Tax=Candidatus Curtissbacteria bacterium RBG_16_39_7 TaxID=1797707 RepID=A0A1F5G1Z4_9BACT|nr:MAG: hypothetical protein A2Z23_02145 [Candidatus Curtissbacteria bacterium RBG_16_39_7]
MRYSNLFGKTLREAPAGETSINAKLLIKGGFVQKLGAGIYTLLPFGLRVTEKISKIVREEMDAICGQELLMPALHPREVWEESGRWQTLHGAMYQLKDSSDKDFGLGFTHEEVVVDLTRGRIFSYRDLPIYLYQIQTKFRDEPRPRSGLIRGREFIMKDLYSFNTDKEGLDKFYEVCAGAYAKIYKRCGLKAIRTKASGGVFTKELTDEFQVLSDGGEDEIFYCPNEDFAENKEIATKKEGDKCPVCEEKLKRSNAIEVGNIFKFGTVYAEKMNMNYADERGNKKPVYLGSYGVGITRTLASVVEVLHDEKGIIWPKSIAPYQVHLVGLGLNSKDVSIHAEGVYEKLEKAGIEVLFDDRKDISAGEKFANADLIGIPVRSLVSDKTPKDKVEWKERDREKTEILELGQVIKNL